MTFYKVMQPIRPRPRPDPYAISDESNLGIGFVFEGIETRQVIPNPPVAGQIGPITYVHFEDEDAEPDWVPLVYRGVTYVVEFIPPPPPTGTKHFSLIVDGYQPFEDDLIPLV